MKDRLLTDKKRHCDTCNGQGDQCVKCNQIIADQDAETAQAIIAEIETVISNCRNHECEYKGCIFLFGAIGCKWWQQFKESVTK